MLVGSWAQWCRVERTSSHGPQLVAQVEPSPSPSGAQLGPSTRRHWGPARGMGYWWAQVERSCRWQELGAGMVALKV